MTLKGQRQAKEGRKEGRASVVKEKERTPIAAVVVFCGVGGWRWWLWLRVVVVNIHHGKTLLLLLLLLALLFLVLLLLLVDGVIVVAVDTGVIVFVNCVVVS